MSATKAADGHRFAFFICGTVVGWLLGLSTSPVLHIVVTSIVAMLATVISGWVAAAPSGQNVRENERPKATEAGGTTRTSLLPVTFLLVGILVGSLLGLYVRTHELLGPKPSAFASRWAGTGLSSTDLQKILFFELHPGLGPQPNKVGTSSPGPAVSPLDASLHAVHVRECGEIITEHGAGLRSKLKFLANDPNITANIDKCSDEALEVIKAFICRD